MVKFELFMFYHNLKNILDNLAAFLESMSVVKTFFKKQVIPSRIWVLEQDHGFLSVHTEGEVC